MSFIRGQKFSTEVQTDYTSVSPNYLHIALTILFGIIIFIMVRRYKKGSN